MADKPVWPKTIATPDCDISDDIDTSQQHSMNQASTTLEDYKSTKQVKQVQQLSLIHNQYKNSGLERD